MEELASLASGVLIALSAIATSDNRPTVRNTIYCMAAMGVTVALWQAYKSETVRRTLMDAVYVAVPVGD